MKSISIFVMLLALVSGLTASAQADLIDRGGGLIYDTELEVTWLQDTIYGFEWDTGRMYWDDAMAWADSLVYQGYDDWRLPHYDISCWYYLAGDCVTSEMGHLFFIEGISPWWEDQYPFINVQPNYYWTGTEYPSDTSLAWDIDFNNGEQSAVPKDIFSYAWAVRDGDSVPVIPEPVSSILFVIGGAALTARNYRRKRLAQRKG
ncbi:MAG TPA: DUF1566 domain-containing protein [Nitrospirae bacterium]|nr:hypothetical protein BMS3Abin06_02875 [bacterium BMS3Abin06]HDH12931.1 DUF1566 domain-containing protein [Nitrospirota bacterium]HDL19856.1 DUF1566 domain-containing protein [Nitrospirota bacterium]HDZ01657.1 DUF1566 domain-containing protein [Nitrospirota bacterium]